ncbi:MAG: hypothetical protein M3Y81_19325 [Chloroflexota bacterium]|nr:hypothetical protein [Chloroflexota bacterium]
MLQCSLVSTQKGHGTMSTSRPGAAEKILARFKPLREHLQPGEEPLSATPAIWDSEQAQRGVPCDVVLTNQRLLGYAFARFPRQRIFLEALDLADITVVSLRQKSHEPLFRELLVSEGSRKVYIRSSRPKIEALYASLRAASEQRTPQTNITLDEPANTEATPAPVSPIYGRQEIRTPFERSPLGLSLLFAGGVLLELLAALLWLATQSAPLALPLFIAGLVCVITAFLTRRR